MQSITFCSYDSNLLPYKATEWAFCRDLKLAEDCTVPPWEVILASTWVKSALPLGRWLKIYARSSLPVKFWIVVANSVWIIDSDYRWEIKIELTSLKWEKSLTAGTRIAQLEICPQFQPEKPFPNNIPALEMIADADIYEDFADKFPSERGEWWFGSTQH